MNRYFDTSALVKYFHKEAGSDIVVSLIQEPINASFISELARLEFKSALYRRFRNKELTASQLNTAIEKFGIAGKNFNIIPVDSLVISRSEHLLRKYGKQHGLRTLDSIHLATYLHYADKNWEFVLSDRTLHVIAITMGIKSVFV